jgi:hypothetical protein
MDETIVHYRKQRRVEFIPQFPIDEVPTAKHLPFCYPKVKKFAIEYNCKGEEGGELRLEAILLESTFMENMVALYI